MSGQPFTPGGGGGLPGRSVGVGDFDAAHRACVEFADSGRPFALAIVLKDVGSTPRKAGAKALIDSNGAIYGTIGGGAVEAEAQRLAVQAIRSRRPLVFDFALEGSQAQDERPICGGTMRILVDPTAADHRGVYAQAVEARRRRQRGVMLTALRIGSRLQVAVQWFPADNVPQGLAFPGREAILSALAEHTPRLLVQDPEGAVPSGPPSGHDGARPSKAWPSGERGEPLEVLVEPLTPAPLLLIGGGGHIGQALALQASLVGFDVVVIDDRSEFADPALYPQGVVTRCGDIARELADFPIAGDTYIALVTRGHRHDEQALAACIHKPAAYIGMIGSRRKVGLIRKDLLQSGTATQEELDRVYAPIGLDIGAQTVPEIAASIVAQLIAVRRTGSAARFSSQ